MPHYILMFKEGVEHYNIQKFHIKNITYASKWFDKEGITLNRHMLDKHSCT